MKKQQSSSEDKCVCTGAKGDEKAESEEKSDEGGVGRRQQRAQTRARMSRLGRILRRSVVGGALVMMWMKVQGVSGEGGRYGPELVIKRSDEEALQLLATVGLATGKQVVDITGNLLQKGNLGGREKG